MQNRDLKQKLFDIYLYIKTYHYIQKAQPVLLEL